MPCGVRSSDKPCVGFLNLDITPLPFKVLSVWLPPRMQATLWTVSYLPFCERRAVGAKTQADKRTFKKVQPLRPLSRNRRHPPKTPCRSPRQAFGGLSRHLSTDSEKPVTWQFRDSCLDLRPPRNWAKAGDCGVTGCHSLLERRDSRFPLPLKKKRARSALTVFYSLFRKQFRLLNETSGVNLA